MNHRFKTYLKAVLFFTFSSVVMAGQLDLGAQYVGWNSNYVQPFNGWELWAPLSLSFKLDPGIGIYAQTEYGLGNYTDSFGGNTETIQLNNFSDSVIGTEISFKSFSVPSILNIGINLPTGDQTWETKQIASSIPTDFINSRYRGRGLGVSAMYGFSVPAGSANIGMAVGYSYGGTFDPTSGSAVDTGQLKLGDALFVAFNHVQPFSGNQSQIIRMSSFYFLSTQQSGSNIYQAGPNINASYSWINPAAFSFDLGAQYYFPAQIPTNGQLVTEPQDSLGPRLYLSPSYVFGDLTVAGVAKYVLPNGYGISDTFYDGGGFLFGIEPSYRLKLDDASALKFAAGYDSIIALNAALDANGVKTNVLYNYWTFGTSYEVKL